MPLLLPAAVAEDEVRLLLLPTIRSNSLTMESSPSPPPPPPLPARNTLSWPSKLKELKDANEHMPIDGTLPVELLRLCRGGKAELGAVMALGNGRTTVSTEKNYVLEAMVWCERWCDGEDDAMTMTLLSRLFGLDHRKSNGFCVVPLAD